MPETASGSAPRGHLFRTYALLINALVGTLLLASAVLSLSFSYRESRDHLMALQLEQAQGAAARIEQYVADIEQQLGWTALAGMGSAGDPMQLRRIDYLKLLRQVPAITEAAWLDVQGLEQVRVSRLAMDAQGQAIDRSAEPLFTEPMAGRVYRSPVSFRKQTEPYMTIARRTGPGSGGGVTVVEVNLKFVWDVVARIHPGGAGVAYTVDGSGALIAHPDISLVLKQTNLAGLPQVAASLQAADAIKDARDLAGQPVLSSWARLDTLGWRVFVESPRSQALEPVYASLQRQGLLLAAGFLISVLASAWLARALVRPIRSLQEGATRIAAGDLDHRISISTGGELQALADEFNHMATELQASYVGLEHKVEARTAELADALAQQTAIAELLKAMGRTSFQLEAILTALIENATRLCKADRGFVYLREGDDYVMRVNHGSAPGQVDARPLRAEMGTLVGRAALTRQLVAIDDAVLDPDYTWKEAQQRLGFRSMLGVPMLRDGEPIGVIAMWREQVRPFQPQEQRLVSTFADQAVIAIENVRLFNETREALEQRTATTEVLQAISRSVADPQPVFEKILDHCERLFGSDHPGIFLVDDEGQLRVGAFRGPLRDRVLAGYPKPLDDTFSAVAIRARRPIELADVLADPATPAYLRRLAEQTGNFAVMVAPLMHGERAIGSIVVERRPPQPFLAKERAQLDAFADQAVIAIQNTELVRQLQSKSRQLEVASRHKSEFLANMSHELRTPLNAIIGFSEVLVEQMFGALNAKQMEYLQDIHSSGQHLLTLINDVLDLAKIEAGRMELELSMIDLPDLLDTALTLVRERAGRQGLQLVHEIDPSLGPWVADARKLKQVLLNLLSNAVKFTPAGGTVTLRARPSLADGAPGVELAVIDTGVGVAPDEQSRIFDAFRQARGHYLSNVEGTGLGLSLARRFVELHGGVIRLQSAPGLGSTFSFTLPERALEAL